METGELIRIKFDKSDVTARIGVFGDSGSGKTLGCKSILSRIYDDGWNIMHFSDVKHDFSDVSHENAAAKEMVETLGLAEGEEPHPVPKKIFQPRFLYDEYNDGKPSYVEPFSLGFKDVSEADFKSLFTSTSQAQERALNNLLARIDLEEQNYKKLKQELDNLELRNDSGDMLEGAIKDSIDEMQNEKLVSSQFRKDLFRYSEAWRCHDCNEFVYPGEKKEHQDHELEQMPTVLVLGLEKYREYFPEESHKFQFYVSAVLDNFIDARKKKQIGKPYIAFFDEAHYVIPRDEDSPAKAKVDSLVNVTGRDNDVGLMISTQKPSQIPMPDKTSRFDITGNLKDIFVAENLNADEWGDLLNTFNFYNSSHRQKWKDRINSMNEKQFLYIDARGNANVEGPEDCPVVEFLSPLWKHPWHTD
ncbi:helicase HerA domain-containing protein [Natrinema sp. H-ect4]|uniref:helicase HerA domain-containing protein n=1 Tax=Natrinema sp. H-ect4 TaxID=3242699 RepID=UPI0035A97107